MELELVTHCIHYARLTSYQMASLVQNPPATDSKIRFTLCYAPTDPETSALVEYFASLPRSLIEWNWMPLEASLVNRRAIGRNRAALATTADWVWFMDGDYCVGPGSLDELVRKLKASPDVKLAFPRQVRATTHHCGDQLIARAEFPDASRMVPDQCWTEVNNFRCAIGGIQMVRGEVCRQRGYLPNHQTWQKPVKTWQRTREDVAFRRALRTRGKAIDVPALFRIRHSAKGRNDPDARL
jgi:hypothetical protein